MEFLANQTVLLKNPKNSPFLHVIKCITDFIYIYICFFLVSSLRLVKTGMAKTVPAVLLGPALQLSFKEHHLTRK